MENNLTKVQLVLLILLSSFVVALTTGIIVVTLVSQTPPPITNTISRVIKETMGIPATSTSQVVIQKETPFIITQEDLIVKIIENINPAVISIIAAKDLPVIEQYFVNPFDDEMFKGLIPSELLPNFQVPQYRQKGTEKRQISSGSGFFVSADGLIITNKHVVEDAEAEYSVIMNNGKKLPAKVLVRDRLQDIAILKVDGGNYNFIPLGNSDALKVGQTVIAIGNALGEFQNTVSVGVISGLKRSIVASGARSGAQTLQALIQTDAAINPGNSGGPLLDLAGRAIGINTAMASGAENIGFALPINIVKKDLNDTQKFGKIKYPFLGVRYALINSKIKEENKLTVDYGALIIKGPKEEPAIAPAGPAEKAGLKEGDIILEFDGVKIDAQNTLAELILKKSVDDTVGLKILRGGKEITVSIILVEMPE